MPFSRDVVYRISSANSKNEGVRMSIVIKANSQVTAQENKELDELCDLAYAGDQSDLAWTDEQDRRVWLEIDNQIVSCLTIVIRQAEVGGVTVRLGGVGGVATLPSQQRKGYAGRVLTATEKLLRDTLRVDFGHLICGPELAPFYARFGWQLVDAPMLIDQPQGKMTLDFGYMVLPCTGAKWPQGTLDLCGLPW
jgi:aminoglycoside 2'-N-acetyltransferase I